MNIHAAVWNSALAALKFSYWILAFRVSVQCVGKVGAEFFHIKLSGTHANHPRPE